MAVKSASWHLGAGASLELAPFLSAIIVWIQWSDIVVIWRFTRRPIHGVWMDTSVASKMARWCPRTRKRTGQALKIATPISSPWWVSGEGASDPTVQAAISPLSTPFSPIFRLPPRCFFLSSYFPSPSCPKTPRISSPFPITVLEGGERNGPGGYFSLFTPFSWYFSLPFTFFSLFLSPGALKNPKIYLLSLKMLDMVLCPTLFFSVFLHFSRPLLSHFSSSFLHYSFLTTPFPGYPRSSISLPQKIALQSVVQGTSSVSFPLIHFLICSPFLFFSSSPRARK